MHVSCDRGNGFADATMDIRGLRHPRHLSSHLDQCQLELATFAPQGTNLVYSVHVAPALGRQCILTMLQLEVAVCLSKPATGRPRTTHSPGFFTSRTSQFQAPKGCCAQWTSRHLFLSVTSQKETIGKVAIVRDESRSGRLPLWQV